MGKIGKCSIEFDNKPLISASASVVGQKEGEGPLGEYFDRVIDDPMAGQNTWEEAESEMQRQLVDELLIKSGLQAKEVRYFFAGDQMCIRDRFRPYILKADMSNRL